MLRMAVLALVLGGCTSIDVIDCIDINGSCSPPPPIINGPSLADAQIPNAVAVDGLWVGFIDGERVEVIGSAEPSEDQDRLNLRADPLATVELVPYEMPFLERPYPYALAANVPVELVVRLRAEDRVRLVDMALTVELPGAEQDKWDLYRVAAAADLTIDVVAAERAWEQPVRVAAAVDDIVALTTYADLAALPPALEVTVCFAALAGDAHVAGLTWEILGDGVVPPSAGAATGGCAVIAEPTDGMVITVRAGGLERTFTARVVTPS